MCLEFSVSIRSPLGFKNRERTPAHKAPPTRGHFFKIKKAVYFYALTCSSNTKIKLSNYCIATPKGICRLFSWQTWKSKMLLMDFLFIRSSRAQRSPTKAEREERKIQRAWLKNICINWRKEYPHDLIWGKSALLTWHKNAFTGCR